MSLTTSEQASLKVLPPSFDHIRSQYAFLRTLFSERNSEYELLRGVFDGTLSQEQRDSAQPGKLTKNRHAMVYNVLNASVRRYMDQLSALPRIDGVARGFEEADLELADKRAKWCTDMWDANDMTVKVMQAGFYQALLDKAIFNVRPSPHLPLRPVTIELGVPDFYYPIARGDNWTDPSAVIYGFRSYDDLKLLQDPMRFRVNEDFVSIIEYWDKRFFVRLMPDKALVLQHNLGFIPWHVAHNLPIPHRERGQGDIDQAIGLQEYLNLLLNSFADMIAYAANPIAVVRGTKVGGTNLPFTERAVWELERDAQVGFLQWNGAPPTTEAQMLRVFQGIEDLTGVNSPAFGREIPSGTSGNAIRSLMAGFNTRLGTKQQLLGDALVKVNTSMQAIAERMIPDQKFEIEGETVSLAAGRTYGKPKEYCFYPKESKGWYRTKVIFQPMDAASTYFQTVDKLEKGIISRFSAMKELGIARPWDELERIRIEKREAADQANDLALAGQGQYVSPEKAAQQQADDQAAMGQLQEQLKGMLAPDAREDRQAKRDVAAAVAAPPPPSAISSPQGPAGPSALPEPELVLDDVLGKLRGAGLSGRAALGGDLVKAGKGPGVIRLENPQEAGTIRQILGSAAAGITFQGLKPEDQLSPDEIELGQKKKGR